MFARSMGPIPAIQIGFPDVCRLWLLIPLILPLPNLSFSPFMIPTVFNIFLQCMPAGNLMAPEAMSLLDWPGFLGGVASNTIAGPTRHLIPSFRVFHGPAPATRMCSLTLQNLFNGPGFQVSPSQIKVVLLT